MKIVQLRTTLVITPAGHVGEEGRVGEALLNHGVRCGVTSLHPQQVIAAARTNRAGGFLLAVDVRSCARPDSRSTLGQRRRHSARCAQVWDRNRDSLEGGEGGGEVRRVD